MTGKLLLVIPPVVRMVNGVYELEVDASNNFRMYLSNFEHVTFACPVLSNEIDGGILRSLPINAVKDSDRLSFVPLPYAYREDRYFRHYLATKKLIIAEIMNADLLLFSPHANYDWSTLAALCAAKMKRKYCIESDWDQRNVIQFSLNSMPYGFKKLRKTLWKYWYLRKLDRCFRRSSLALLQGQDVFDAYKDVAPNPHKVLNVQVSSDDYLPPSGLQEKLAKINERNPLRIAYAGRMIGMKGPLDWLMAISVAVKAGVELRATWFGDGSLLSQMQQEVDRLGIREKVTFAGIVGREQVMSSLRKTDIFLFCHKTGESPRCLGEALATGCSLVGYGTAYSRDLVAIHGGGEFTEIGEWQALGETIISLDQDRPRLGHLIEAAATSGRLLDRDSAIQNRIDRIKEHLTPSDSLR